MIKEIMDKQIYELKKLWSNKRQLTFQVLNLAMIVFSALMIWKGLMFVTKSESPVVVVLSGSMEPAFQRGDILFLNNAVHDVTVGDVVVFKIKDRDIPIVHRILKVHRDDYTGQVELLTKGDNNRVDDRGLYAPGQLWLGREDILGKLIVFFLCFVQPFHDCNMNQTKSKATECQFVPDMTTTTVKNSSNNRAR